MRWNCCNWLRALGVQLAIDDFGTGYSSLQRLKRMNVHKLKIDQGFVRGLPADREDAAITRSVIGLAHNLGLKVVAGDRDADQAAFLLEQNCDYGQKLRFRPTETGRRDRLATHRARLRTALPLVETLTKRLYQ